jgi:transposase
MFVRVKKRSASDKRTVQIVENIRLKDRVSQRIVQHVGTAVNDAQEEKMRRLAEDYMSGILAQRHLDAKQTSLIALTETDINSRSTRGRPAQKRLADILPTHEVTLDVIEEQARFVEGLHDVVGPLFDALYGGLLDQSQNTLLKDIVLSRLFQPSSKREAQRVLKKHFGKLHDISAIYRMMDALVPRIAEIKQRTFDKTRALFPEGIDLLLFDVTTLYFESVTTDELRRFGYSKDHRFNTTQVVLALATNAQGLPVGYELFEGNKAEVTTLAAAIDAWQTLFKIASVCIVGDRAMFTKQNIALMQAKGYHYIIAAKLKTLPVTLQQSVFNAQHYRACELNNELAWVGEWRYEGARLIVSYKFARAQKDKHDRQAIIDKIQKTLKGKGPTKKLIANAGVKQFVRIDEHSSAELDMEKIKQAERWDGLHGVISNIEDESPHSLIARYARLWVIEESFRINKHTLKMRPIFHWKSDRIHAHIALSYMAFSLLRHLQYRINQSCKMTIQEIINELSDVQASIHRHKVTGDFYRVPGYMTHRADTIYKIMGVKRNRDAHVYLNAI